MTVAEALTADDVCRLKSWSACEEATRRLEHAEQWLEGWQREAALRRQGNEQADAAVEAEQGAARRARQDAAARGVQPVAEAKREQTRLRIVKAWNRLLPVQRGPGAVSALAKILGLSAPTVRGHLRDAGLYQSQVPREK